MSFQSLEIIMFAVGASAFIVGFVLGRMSSPPMLLKWEEAQIQAQMKDGTKNRNAADRRLIV